MHGKTSVECQRDGSTLQKKSEKKMQVDAGAHGSVISSFIWTELGKPQLDWKIRLLKAYDGLRSKYRQQHLTVVQSDKNLDYLGETHYPMKASTMCVMRNYLQSKDTKRM